jgi:hypothetical protein
VAKIVSLFLYVGIKAKICQMSGRFENGLVAVDSNIIKLQGIEVCYYSNLPTSFSQG